MGVSGDEDFAGSVHTQTTPGFPVEMRGYSMIWLSIAVVKKAAGDLIGDDGGCEDYKKDAMVWALDLEDQAHPTSIACCCRWISAVLPDGKWMNPKELSHLLLTSPTEVRNACNRYLQANLPNFEKIFDIRFCDDHRRKPRMQGVLPELGHPAPCEPKATSGQGLSACLSDLNIQIGR